MSERSLVHNGGDLVKFPTSIFENLLQNNDLLEALFKQIPSDDSMNNNNNNSNTISTNNTTNDLITAQELVFNDLFGKKDIEEPEDTSKIYGNPFVGPNLWNKEELFSCDKLGLQFEFLDTEDFLAENDFNATDMSFLQNVDVNQQTSNNINMNNNSEPIVVVTNSTVVTSPTVSQTKSVEKVIVNNAKKPILNNEIIPDDLLMDISSPISSTSSSRSSTTTTTAAKSTKKPNNKKSRKNSSDSSSKFSFLDDELSQLTAEQLLEKVEHFGSDDEDMDDLDSEYGKTKKRNIPDELKDEKYWNRRRQNNMAAKRSRDARRLKESEVALKASFLERENMILKRQLEEYKQETKVLKVKLARYERKNK